MSTKKLTGKIVSAKMQKTVVIAVEVDKKHNMYSKSVRNTKKFKARNETEAKLNDMVVVEECRPYAKDVSWKIVEKVKEK